MFRAFADRACVEDQPQQVRLPRGAGQSENRSRFKALGLVFDTDAVRNGSNARVRLVCVAAFMSLSLPASACSACFGNSDSSMALGMNWGIFSLLGVVVCVLGSVAGFFVYLAKKSAALNAAALAAAASAATNDAEHAEEREREPAGALD